MGGSFLGKVEGVELSEDGLGEAAGDAGEGAVPIFQDSSYDFKGSGMNPLIIGNCSAFLRPLHSKAKITCYCRESANVQCGRCGLVGVWRASDDELCGRAGAR